MGQLRYSLILILSFFTIHLSFAEVRYVSHSGSNTPPYLSWETAADSIISAINISSFGDTIYVANETYEEVVDMIAGLALIGAGSDSCIIDSRNFQNFPGYTVEVVDSCIFSGFGIFSFNNNTGHGIDIGGGANSIVTNCRIQEAYYGVIIWTAFQNKPIITKNIVLNTTYGISNFFSQAIIKENIVYANYASGGIGGGTNSRATFLNNVVICNSCADAYDGTNSILKNNLFYGNGDFAMFSYSDIIQDNVILGENGSWDDGIFGADQDIRNNHIENATNGIRYDVGGGSFITVKYNNLWHNQINFKNFTPDTTNIASNPMFYDALSQDFHLQLFSPLIDAWDPAR